jgi:outer membrane lipoprotein-sorting protein
MKLLLRSFTVFLALIPLCAAPQPSKEALQQVLTRLDKAANNFNAMKANVSYLTHTDVLNEDSTETGTVVMKKVQPGEVQGLVQFVTPDAWTLFFEKRSLQRYYPKIKTVQIWDLGTQGEQLDKFLMIGFGTSGLELARDYHMTVIGTENLKGQPAVQLELIPKSSQAREYMKKMLLWIPETGDPYPLQEKILQSSGDYRLVTYSDLIINPPLKANALELKLPPGVKKEYPGK